MTAPPEPVAEWDFAEPGPPYHATRGRSPLPLRDGPGSSVRTVHGSGFGTAAAFDGTTSFLRIPATQIGELNVAARGDAVTVLAWVRRTADHLGFVAGIWQEDDGDPRRQYGLFVDLGLYGGKDRVVGHVSATGGASSGLPYSRDCSASARMLDFTSWRMIGFTYDGRQAISYLDGLADARPAYTEPGPPYGRSETYAKNPFPFRDGLNRRSVADFTVGAVRLSRGMHNFFGGQIARLAVYDTALSPRDVMGIHLDGLIPGNPIADLNFYRVSDTMVAHYGGAESPEWPLELFGWKGWSGHDAGVASATWAGCREDDRTFVATTRDVRTDGASPAALVYDTIVGLPLEQVGHLAFSLGATPPPGVRVIVRVGDRWFASATSYHHDARGFRGVRLEPRTAGWQPLALRPGASLGLADGITRLPSGDLTGVGFYDDRVGTGAGLRVSGIAIWP